eukprot:764585-Hanusia_phi.AAC.4
MPRGDDLVVSDQKIAEKTKEKDEASALAKRLEKQIQEYSKSWDKLLAAKEKEIADAKDLLAELNAKLKATREENETILLDSQASAEELKAIEEQITAGEEALVKCEEEVAALEQAVKVKRSAFDEAEAELKERREAMKQADKDIQEASKVLAGGASSRRLTLRRSVRSQRRSSRSRSSRSRSSSIRSHGEQQEQLRFSRPHSGAAALTRTPLTPRKPSNISSVCTRGSQLSGLSSAKLVGPHLLSPPKSSPPLSPPPFSPRSGLSR